jgi:7-cyano-7-deazaguanine synthase in queuosine biosynthesis
LCDVSVFAEWEVVGEVEVTDFGEVHDRVTSPVRVMIHVKTGLVIRGTGAIPRRSRRGYAPSQRQFPTVFVPFQNTVSASVGALVATPV